MQTILNWLGKYNISTHALGIIALALTAAYEGYKPFHDLVTSLYTGLPTPVQVLIGTGGFLFALYKSGALNGPASPPASGSNGTQKLGALALIAILLQGTLVFGGGAVVVTHLTGCTPAQVENEVNTILQEATSIIAVADPGVTWLAAFSKATALLKVDEANWIAGGAVQDMINVLVDLQGVTALISPLVPYAALIGVLVAGIVAVLSLLLPSPPPPPPAALTMPAAQGQNPFKGMTTVKNRADSLRQWRAIVAANPALAAAKL
jgi:hypothetical protein